MTELRAASFYQIGAFSVLLLCIPHQLFTTREWAQFLKDDLRLCAVGLRNTLEEALVTNLSTSASAAANNTAANNAAANDNSANNLPENRWHVCFCTTGQTIALGQILGKLLQAGDVLVLTGDLGAGKTLYQRYCCCRRYG